MLRFAVLLWRVLSSRAVKVLIYLWIIAWGFDRAIFWATEAAWFQSVGQGAWFGARIGAQFGLFWGTFALALVCAALAMRVAARPVAGAELRTLSGVLEPLEPVRRNATRLAWLVLIVGAWSVARHIAGGWDVVLAARAGDLSNPIYGLPLARLLLGAWWQWSLFLLGALAFAGILRALPILAQREPAPPLRLYRALSVVGALVLLARAALCALAWSENYSGDGTTGSELFIDLPLAVTGVVLCLLAAFWCFKRPGFQKLGLAAFAALFAPHLLRILLTPLALVVPTPAPIEARNQAATRTGWGLDDARAIAANAPPLSSHWPIWNEKALLGLALGQHARNAQHVIDWKRATIGPREAIIAGVPAGLENFGSPHEADAGNGIEWLAFDATQNINDAAPVVADASLPLLSFYGLGGRALLGDNAGDAGVPFEFWGWKFAWAWRLRDPLLMLEGARAPRLLVFRGARESAERLAPFLIWDEAQLRSTPSGPRWEFVGYAKTPYYRGALAAREGAFAGSNAATPAAILRVDPRNGRAEFTGTRGANWGAPYAQILGAGAVEKALVPTPQTPLLEETRALVARQIGLKNALAESVWTWRDGRGENVRYAPNLPAGIDEKLALLDSAARREWARAEGAQLEMGDALLWPDARAPGGFWVGRPYYAMTKTAGATTNGVLARSAKLWRVSLTGLANSPLAHGENAAAALVNFDLQNAARGDVAGATGAAPATKNEIALQALRAHDLAYRAAKASNWVEWAKQSARERALLQQLAAR